MRSVIEIKSLKGIEKMKNIISSMREHIQEEEEMNRILYDIYDNYIEKLYNIILASIDEGELYREQAALFDPQLF